MTENVYDYDAKQRAQDIVNQIDQGKLPENPNYETQGVGAIGNISSNQGYQGERSEQGQTKTFKLNSEWDNDHGYVEDKDEPYYSYSATRKPFSWNSVTLGDVASFGLQTLGATAGTIAAGPVGGAVGGYLGYIAGENPKAPTAMIRDEIPDFSSDHDEASLHGSGLSPGDHGKNIFEQGLGAIGSIVAGFPGRLTGKQAAKGYIDLPESGTAMIRDEIPRFPQK